MGQGSSAQSRRQRRRRRGLRRAGRRLKPLLQSLGPVNTVGESFTVYKVLDVDVSLPRRESKTGRGHRAFEVVGDPDMSPEDAARRRDFTVNAIAWDPLRGRLSRSVRWPARSARAASAARRRSAHVRRRQPARAPRHPVRGAIRPRDGSGPTRDLCRDISARRPSGRARLGRDRKAAPARRPAGSRLRAGARARRHRSACSPN